MQEAPVSDEPEVDATGPDGNREPTDGQLLARFIEHAEKAAFEALVSRHKSMVMGVCRRMLRDEHAAEDAFQATFMVLLRKSKLIGRPELLANWLYGVAFRIARKARIKAGRERAAAEVVEIEAPKEVEFEPEWIELKGVLDEELSQLPAKHRLPLVLCYLDGKTNIEAARLLGCPDGSIANRLSVARAELRRRMQRRGMVLSAALVALLLEHDSATAAVSEGLIEKTLDGMRYFLKTAASAGSAAMPEATNDPEDGSPSATAAPPLVGSAVLPLLKVDLKSRRRRFSRIPTALLWLLMLSWIGFPIYDLVGASLVRSGGSRPPAVRVNRHSGAILPLGPIDRDILAAGAAGTNPNEALRDSDPAADDDDRCKVCLGTNCGSHLWKAARSVAQNSFLKKFMFWK